VESAAHPANSLTVLLQAWRQGDTSARDQFFSAVYHELHRIARHHMRHERAGHTLQASALVNEAYLRLIDADKIQWQDRAHFLGVAAHFMRRILVDAARRKGFVKRGGGAQRGTFDEAVVVSPEPRPDLVALDDALDALAKMDPRKSRVVELRFFGGLTVTETAGVLDVSPQTVLRDWSLAKVWLTRELERGGGQ
jgi:RNA polymerase sigma factor (TIGR02999 family)